MLTSVCVLVYIICVLETDAEICEQDEFGQVVDLNCSSLLAPYCCIYNGKPSCCSEDEYNRLQNGLSTNTLLVIAIAACIVIACLFYWCYIKYRRKSAIEKEERQEMDRQIRRLSRIQQKLSFSEQIRVQQELYFLTQQKSQQKVIVSEPTMHI